MDHETTIEDLKNQVRQFVSERNWEQFHSPKDLAIAIAIEAAELLELFRFREINSDEIRLQILEESTDILIFLLALANVVRFDTSLAFEDKMALNRKKYPIKESYGSAKKYNELG
jgi:dCTP diphosphatase